MKVYENKEIQVIKEVLVKTICDICGKEVPLNHYEVTTGHHDWGNDSIESIENFDICSDECLKEQFNIYLKSRYRRKFIEIEHE